MKGLSSVKIASVEDFLALFKASMMLRRTRETKANSQSSRSHLCVQLEYKIDVASRKINFWDLAGSEKFTSYQEMEQNLDQRGTFYSSREKQGMKREYSSINRSLATLGRIIQMLGKSPAAN